MLDRDTETKLRGIKELYIFGAGKVGRIVIHRLLAECPDIQIKGILVSNKEENPEFLYGIPVMSFSKLQYDQRKTTILIAVMEKSQKEVQELLSENKYNDVITISDNTIQKWEEQNKSSEHVSSRKWNYVHRYMDPLCKKVNELKERGYIDSGKYQELIASFSNADSHQKFYINRLVTILGTKCSLRCRECNNLIPYFSPQTDMDEEVIIHSLRKILSVVDGIIVLELIGGEPFLAKSLQGVLQFCIAEIRIQHIEITTNGTLLPREELIPWLKNRKIEVKISDYGNMVDQTKVIQWLDIHNINYNLLREKSWISAGGIDKRGKPLAQLRKEYLYCGPGYECKTLLGNRIFSCARAASLWALGYMVEDEFIETDKITYKQIEDFWIKDYSVACDYCDYSLGKKIIPAEQI